MPDPLLSAPILPAPVATVPAAAIPPENNPQHEGKLDPKPERGNSGQGADHRTLPALPATASATAQAQLQRRTVAVPPTETKPAAPAAPPAPVPIAAMAPTEEVRAELLLPRLTAPSALIRDEARPLAKVLEFALPDAASSVGFVLPQLQSPAAAQTVPIPQIRPHDFAALIERISVAREAAAPQAVSITLTHQDFGPVRLNFRPEDSGLSVAMSSADPGFARAAAAAPAPVLPVTASDSAQFGQQQRGESGAAQTGGQGQSRGGSAEHRRDGQPQPQANSAPRSSRPGAAQRSGIFA